MGYIFTGTENRKIKNNLQRKVTILTTDTHMDIRLYLN